MKKNYNGKFEVPLTKRQCMILLNALDSVDISELSRVEFTEYAMTVDILDYTVQEYLKENLTYVK